MKERPVPLTVAFVSGKGGVGKTMLAVAFARELSLRAATLLIDLDFFNRGLTGLMRRGKTICKLDPPEFLSIESREQDEWSIIEVAPRLYHWRFPDLSEDALHRIENYDVHALAEHLQAYLEVLRQHAGAVNIVLDCHGGPDKLSFAACVIARHSLLISEPDKITFYGTLHFMRQLEASVGGAGQTDLHLVFNKVVPAFSVGYLQSFYDQEIRPLFGGKALLAVFPLEVYLTKEFEKTPLLTDVYPFSLLARKMQVLVYDLLCVGAPGNVPAVAASLTTFTRAYRRRTLGKPLPLFNMNVVTGTITAGVIIAVLFATLANKIEAARSAVARQMFELQARYTIQHAPGLLRKDCQPSVTLDPLGCLYREYTYPTRTDFSEINEILRAPPLEQHEYVATGYGPMEQAVDIEADIAALRNRPDLQNEADPEIGNLYRRIMSSERVPPSISVPDNVYSALGIVAAYWFFLTLLLSWSHDLDRRFTYLVRLRHYVSAAIPYLGALIVWFLAALYFAGSKRGLEPRNPLNPIPWHTVKFLFYVSTVPAWIAIGDQTLKSWAAARFRRRLGEALARAIFALFIPAATVTMYILFR